jgi:hypothetical protein
MEMMRHAHGILCVRLQGKRTLGTNRRRWDDNGFEKMWYHMNTIDMAYSMDQ